MWSSTHFILFRKAFLGQLYAEVEYLSNLQLGAKGAGLSR